MFESVLSLAFSHLTMAMAMSAEMAMALSAENPEDQAARKPAWEDEHDATVVVDVSRVSRLKKLRTTADEKVIPATEYANRLRAQHAKMNPGTEWAELPWQKTKKNKRRREQGGDDFGLGFGLEEEEEEDEYEKQEGGHRNLLLEQSELVVKSKSRLPQGLLELSRVKDANDVEPSEAVVQSVEFHRNGQLLMTAGFDKKLRFFQVFHRHVFLHKSATLIIL